MTIALYPQAAPLAFPVAPDDAVGPLAQPSRKVDPDQIRAFLRELWGDRAGYGYLARGENGHTRNGRYEHESWQELSFRWPDEEAVLLALVQAPPREGVRTLDWYATPALFERRERSKDACLPLTHLWLDMDGATPPEVAPTLRVASGSPGHYHAYWRLAAPLPREDAERLSKALAYAHAGGDRGKWAANAFLRLPGTYNYKDGTHPAPVQLTAGAGTGYRPDDFAGYLAALPDGGRAPAPIITRTGGVSSVRGRDLLATYRLGDDAWRLFTNEASDDRSRDLFRLGCICREAGLTREETFTVLRDSAVNKFAADGRADEELRLRETVDNVWDRTAPREQDTSGSFYAVRDGEIRLVRRDRRVDPQTGVITWPEAPAKRLANFDARVVRDIVKDDGDGAVTREFALEGRTARGRTFSCRIDAGEFGNTERLRAALQTAGGSSLVMEPRLIAELGAAILELSGEVPEERVYTHTGWAEVGGTRVVA